MVKSRKIAILAGASAFVLIGALAADDALPVEHAECTFFGPHHDKIVRAGARGFVAGRLVGPYSNDVRRRAILPKQWLAHCLPFPRARAPAV
jgi:hypothetical protein